MAWGRARKAVRTPHPDPRTEQQLQQILSLIAAAERWTILIETYQEAISGAHESAYDAEHSDTRKSLEMVAKSAAGREKVSFERITVVEEQIASAQEQITALMNKLEDSDLAYLYPVPR